MHLTLKVVEPRTARAKRAVLELDGPRLVLRHAAAGEASSGAAPSGVARTTLRAARDVRYLPNARFDWVEAVGLRLVVPRGKAPRLLSMLALAELQSLPLTGWQLCPPLSPFVEPPDALGRAWLERFLRRDEWLLGWLPTASRRRVQSPWLAAADAATWLLVTDARCALVAIGEQGGQELRVLPRKPLVVTGEGSSHRIGMGPEQVIPAKGWVERYAALAQAPSLAPEQRLRNVCGAAWVDARNREGIRTLCLEWLSEASRRGDALAPFARWWLDGDALAPPPPESARALQQLRTESASVAALGELWQQCGIDTEAGLALARRLRDLGPVAQPYAAGLHARVHEARGAGAELRRGLPRAEADLELAEHLLDAGLATRAQDLAKRASAAIRRRSLVKIANPPTATERALSAMLEVEARACRSAGQSDVEALRSRARLTPLDPAPLVALSTAAAPNHPKMAERARVAARLLQRPLFEPLPGAVQLVSAQPGGEQAAPRAVSSASVRGPLTQQAYQELLPSEARLELSRYWGYLQGALAAVPRLDPTQLRAYVESLESRAPEAAHLLERARIGTGLPRVEGYVSRGAQSLGVRGFEAPTPLVLVGQRHLEPGDASCLSGPELAFALAAECTHLRLGQARVTAAEVWWGAALRGRQGLDLAFGFLGSLKGLKLLDRVGKLGTRVPPALSRQVGSRLTESLERAGMASLRPRPQELSQVHEQLVLAHRYAQLRADRAALVLGGELDHALGAIVKTREDYHSWFQSRAELPVAVALLERHADGDWPLRELALRVAALIEFWVSDDYPRLRKAIA